MTEFVDFAFAVAGASTERTLPTRLTDAINVKDWGAVGDGVADDTEAIARAIGWNDIRTSTGDPITTTTHTYSGAFRILVSTWAAGVVTSTTTEPHGWTIGVPLNVELRNNWNGGVGGNQPIDGVRTITPQSTTTFTFSLASDIRPFGYYGNVRPVVTAATWASNVVTLTFSAAHRLDGITSAQPCTIAGFVPSGINGSRVITGTPTSTTLTFAVTGGATVTTLGTCKPEPWITVGTVPTGINVVDRQALGSHNPTLYAQYFLHTIQSETASKIWFGSTVSPITPFQADIPVDTELKIALPDRGVLFFPAGEYKITEPIYLTDVGLTFVMRGVPGKSIIRGNFPGYLFNQELKSAGSGPTLIEKMRFVNDDPAGKGLRLCQVNTQVRDCVFEANEGLSFASNDYVAAVSFSAVVAGCRFNPGTQPTGSIGLIAATNNASILGNHFSGLDEGMRMQSFGKTVAGNVFEDNVVGLRSGVSPIGTNQANTYQVIAGNTFINNGTGYLVGASSGIMRVDGNYIEGGASASLGWSRTSGAGTTLVRGLDIGGAFSTAAWSGATAEAHSRQETVRAVRALDSGAVSFSMPTTSSVATFMECNKAHTLTFAQLKGRKITSAVWDSTGGGRITYTTSSTHGFSGGFGIVVQGVKIGGSTANGYNGASITATASVGSTTTVLFSITKDPGAAADANTGIIVSVSSGATNNRPLRSITWAADEVTYRVWGTHDISSFSNVVVGRVTQGDATSRSISGAVNNGSGLIRLTVPNVTGWTDGDTVVVASVGGTTEANGTWVIDVIDATHIDLVGSSFVNAYTSGGSIACRYNATFTPAQLTVVSSDEFKVSMIGDPGDPDAASIPASAALGRDALASAVVSGATTTMGDTTLGEAFNITDGAKLGGGTAVIGDLVQGGGSQHIKVRWTADGWARVG